LKTTTTAVTNAQAELDVVETSAGLNADGTFTADATTNYLTTATSIKDANKKLDTQLKTTTTACNKCTGRT